MLWYIHEILDALEVESPPKYLNEVSYLRTSLWEQQFPGLDFWVKRLVGTPCRRVSRR